MHENRHKSKFLWFTFRYKNKGHISITSTLECSLKMQIKYIYNFASVSCPTLNFKKCHPYLLVSLICISNVRLNSQDIQVLLYTPNSPTNTTSPLWYHEWTVQNAISLLHFTSCSFLMVFPLYAHNCDHILWTIC